MYIVARIIITENGFAKSNADFIDSIITESNLLKLYAERDKQNIPIKIEILDERPVEDDWRDITYFLEKRTTAKFK